jgi:CheY-like chemotaxis protein
MKQNVPTFILIDDEPMNHVLCRERIASYVQTPHSVFEFTKGEAGLSYITSSLPPEGKITLFLDIHMPGMNGWEFLEKFSSLDNRYHERINIYIVSSSMDPADEKRAQEHVFVKGFSVKPIADDILGTLGVY